MLATPCSAFLRFGLLCYVLYAVVSSTALALSLSCSLHLSLYRSVALSLFRCWLAGWLADSLSSLPGGVTGLKKSFFRV